MPRLPSRFVGLLGSLVASCALGQMPEEEFLGFEQLSPAVDLQPIQTESPGPLFGEAMASDLPAQIETVIEPSKPDPLDGFLGYRYESSPTEWIVGTGDQFGMFSFKWDHYQRAGVNHGFDGGFQFHLLSGPVRTDMPPRVYDFSIAYQHRDQLGEFAYDVAAAVMASGDFEGSSREGIRFPGHAVGFLSVGPTTELVFGVDYLDQGHIKLLPVVGLIARPHPNVRIEAIFPRPRVVFQLTDKHQLYVGGELGGGTWAVERTTMVDDLATYHDLRLCVGLQHIKKDNRRRAIEIGYLFDRHLEYTSGNGDFRPIDTAMIRFVETF